MRIGVIADDLTGASDIAGVLAAEGLRTWQMAGLPAAPAPPDADALVVSLKIRSVPAADAVAQALGALEWLLAQGW